MNFISYAQNFEDAMLWRALKHITHGFYIDVGANDPVEDSVTKAFYDRGWRGINIEPLSHHYHDLARERPHDINLQVAAGPTNGEIKIWECDVRGWATADQQSVLSHSEAGHKGEYRTYPQYRLSDICEKHAEKEIHFLKIDVEGFEKSVIEGMDFAKFRPWVLVIEATKPNTTEENHHEWEPDILGFNYIFAYTDGINRFYVAKEHSELLASLKYPPNVLDGFKHAREVALESEIARLAQGLHELNSTATVAAERERQADIRAQQAEVRAQQALTREHYANLRAEQANAWAEQLNTLANLHLNQLRSVYSSTSWKVTRPLRGLVRLIRGDFAKAKLGNELAHNSRQNIQHGASSAVDTISHEKLDAPEVTASLTAHAKRTYSKLNEAMRSSEADKKK